MGESLPDRISAAGDMPRERSLPYERLPKPVTT